ncbi:protein SIEVE ELEMENT OCCLUSION B-like [Telopea speciosissima]|uniref:protein SIEVE ELEMENT OCCLUSION B-like n=1 Tax=Telopea speciosissima TaxID=54955 RepID=UPI001CC761C5|nr:protein SIEVE ELEMENT OCCLUSION B-like [Telopea speciosissima]
MAITPPTEPQQRLNVPQPQQVQQQEQQMTPQQQQQQQGDVMHVPTAPPPPHPPVATLTRTQSQGSMRDGPHMSTTSDDNVMMKQILDTHSHDGQETVDVKPLLQLIEKILQRSSSTTTLQGALPQHDRISSQMDSLEEKTQQEALVGKLEALSSTIHKISCEISCTCSGGGDAHSTTVVLFNTLSRYTWDAKMVLALAAFAVNYGEFWLVAEFYSTHPLAKSIALLKQLPDALECSDSLKPRFEALKSLIKVMVDVTKCIVQFNELPREYISSDRPPFSVVSGHIPTAVYWTVRSVVACASQIISLIGLGDEYVIVCSLRLFFRLLTLSDQLPMFVNTVTDTKHIGDGGGGGGGGIAEEKKHELVRLFETTHDDNMEILKALIKAKESNPQLPLLEGSTKSKIYMGVLRRKYVLLLISDLNISQEELSILEPLYKESREQPTRPESQYEMVWFPVVDRTLTGTEAKQSELFDKLQSRMPWYSVHNLSLIDQIVIDYIKDVWHFNKKPILVVLNPQGRVVHLNALHMMWIWGSHAFPFTSMREEDLWKEEQWRLEFLVDGIDQNILNWIMEDRFICLYGGEDIEWIRKFTKAARVVAQEARIPLEMVYVGKSNPKEIVRTNINVITTEELSNCWKDFKSIWYFWIRLESMRYSKMQLGKSIENDHIMQEIMSILTFDGSEQQGWALISKGSANMAKAKGDMILSCFEQYDQWKEEVDVKGFIPAFNDHLQKLHTPHQ